VKGAIKPTFNVFAACASLGRAADNAVPAAAATLTVLMKSLLEMPVACFSSVMGSSFTTNENINI
jgi:hypothetical protein